METDGPDWARLAARLIDRRAELGYGGRQRAAFARDRGLSHTRTIDDLENQRRTNFDAATLAQVERIYGWKSGSVAAVLAGGEATPADDIGAAATSADIWEAARLAEIEERDLSEAVKSELRAIVRLQAANMRIAEDRIRHAAS